MVALGHSGSFGWLRSPRPYGGLRRGYGHRSLGRVITAVPLARAGALDLVVAHLLDSVDVGPYRGEEAGELRTAAEPPQVSIGRVPLDADGVGGRIVGAARDLVALAVSRGTERERVRERTRRLLVVARGRLHAAALSNMKTLCGSGFTLSGGVGDFGLSTMVIRLPPVRARRRTGRRLPVGLSGLSTPFVRYDRLSAGLSARSVRPAREQRGRRLWARAGGDARSLSGSRSFAVGVGRRRSRDALGRREHERGVACRGPDVVRAAR